jgi:hypothetical protein
MPQNPIRSSAGTELVARKFDGSRARRKVGRPQVDADVEQLIVCMARENPSWGYDRIAGALANLGHRVSDQTVGNVLRRRGIPPAPQRKRTTTWAAFIRAHLAVLAGTDFFSVEVFTLRGLEGSQARLPAPSPRGTERDSFPSLGSSSTKASIGTALTQERGMLPERPSAILTRSRCTCLATMLEAHTPGVAAFICFPPH